MPLMLYQIQTKFRDEARPRGGLVRVREFTMKDAYSFDADWEALDDIATARRARPTCASSSAAACRRSRCRRTPAPSAARTAEEFIFLTEVGEDTILLCPSCGYAANAEKADFTRSRRPRRGAAAARGGRDARAEDDRRAREVPRACRTTRRCKAVFYEADGEPVFVAIRGDLEVNEVKLRERRSRPSRSALLDEQGVRKHGLVAGSASPVGLKGMHDRRRRYRARRRTNLVAGANKPDVHFRNVNHGRDWTADIVADIALAQAGDACPNCGTALEDEARHRDGPRLQARHRLHRAAAARTFPDEAGELQPAIMGCYGIGVGRVFASASSRRTTTSAASSGRRGLAPYDVHLVGLGLRQAGRARERGAGVPAARRTPASTCSTTTAKRARPA